MLRQWNKKSRGNGKETPKLKEKRRKSIEVQKMAVAAETQGEKRKTTKEKKTRRKKPWLEEKKLENQRKKTITDTDDATPTIIPPIFHLVPCWFKKKTLSVSLLLCFELAKSLRTYLSQKTKRGSLGCRWIQFSIPTRDWFCAWYGQLRKEENTARKGKGTKKGKPKDSEEN